MKEFVVMFDLFISRLLSCRSSRPLATAWEKLLIFTHGTDRECSGVGLRLARPRRDLHLWPARSPLRRAASRRVCRGGDGRDFSIPRDGGLGRPGAGGVAPRQ